VGCDEYKIIDEKLEGLNYNKINETSIQTCEIAEGHPNEYERIIIHSNFDEQWIRSVINYNEIDRMYAPTFAKIVGNIAVDKIVVSKIIGGEIAACGYGAIENGYVGIFDVVVKEDLRGKGYGREIVGAIMAEAAKRGVKKSYLQVMINNPAALHLYEKIGFREIYRYWYRKKA
jgi:ribosomal protein S18 acetylase RimI-like enzyme